MQYGNFFLKTPRSYSRGHRFAPELDKTVYEGVKILNINALGLKIVFKKKKTIKHKYLNIKYLMNMRVTLFVLRLVLYKFIVYLR